jgi:hypothetical protein
VSAKTVGLALALACVTAATIARADTPAKDADTTDNDSRMVAQEV